MILKKLFQSDPFNSINNNIIKVNNILDEEIGSNNTGNNYYSSNIINKLLDDTDDIKKKFSPSYLNQFNRAI